MNGGSGIGLAKHRAGRRHCGRSKLYDAARVANEETQARAVWRARRRGPMVSIRELFS